MVYCRLNQLINKMKSKQIIVKQIRTGNKLMLKAINECTNPLGGTNHKIHLEHWIAKQRAQSFPGPQIADYFEKQYDKEENLILIAYHRPRVKGTDGLLYSAADMDNAMLYGG